MVEQTERSNELYNKGLAFAGEEQYELALVSFKESNELHEHSRIYARIYECLEKLGRHNETKP